MISQSAIALEKFKFLLQVNERVKTSITCDEIVFRSLFSSSYVIDIELNYELMLSMCVQQFKAINKNYGIWSLNKSENSLFFDDNVSMEFIFRDTVETKEGSRGGGVNFMTTLLKTNKNKTNHNYEII